MAIGVVLNRSRQVPAEETTAFGAVAERFRRAGDLERAISLCREGLVRFPDHLSARVTLGWALLDSGQYDDARVELEWVIRRAPDNLAAIRGLAQLHEHRQTEDLGDLQAHADRLAREEQLLAEQDAQPVTETVEDEYEDLTVDFSEFVAGPPALSPIENPINSPIETPIEAAMEASAETDLAPLVDLSAELPVSTQLSAADDFSAADDLLAAVDLSDSVDLSADLDFPPEVVDPVPQAPASVAEPPPPSYAVPAPVTPAVAARAIEPADVSAEEAIAAYQDAMPLPSWEESTAIVQAALQSNVESSLDSAFPSEEEVGIEPVLQSAVELIVEPVAEPELASVLEAVFEPEIEPQVETKVEPEPLPELPDISQFVPVIQRVAPVVDQPPVLELPVIERRVAPAAAQRMPVFELAVEPAFEPAVDLTDESSDLTLGAMRLELNEVAGHRIDPSRELEETVALDVSDLGLDVEAELTAAAPAMSFEDLDGPIKLVVDEDKPIGRPVKRVGALERALRQVKARQTGSGLAWQDA